MFYCYIGGGLKMKGRREGMGDALKSYHRQNNE